LKHWPGLKKGSCKEALFYPQEVSVDPQRFVSLVIDFLVDQHGLSYYPYTIVNAIDENSADGCMIRTNTAQQLVADQVILCAGSEFQLLFPGYYSNEELSCVKIHMMITKPQPAFRIKGNILSGLSIRRYESFKECDAYHRIQVQQEDPIIAEAGIHILIKQTDNGQLIIGDAHHYADAHDQEDLGYQLSQPVLNYILDRAKGIIEPDTFDIHGVWTGLYTQAKQEDIILKHIGQRIHIVNGIGGKGMTAGPGYMYYYINKLFNHD
jgi:FAD dependent oxidoreductase TIGR03364